MPEPKRRFFQIHLSTAIVLMFVAGGLIWANVRTRMVSEWELFERVFNSIPAHGWPWPFWYDYRLSFGWFLWLVFVLDLLIGALVLIEVARICEFFVRLPSRKPVREVAASQHVTPQGYVTADGAIATSDASCKHRWLPRFRFSLRTLLIFVLLCGSGFGLWWRWEPWVLDWRYSPPADADHTMIADESRVFFSPDDSRVLFITCNAHQRDDCADVGPPFIYSFSVSVFESRTGCWVATTLHPVRAIYPARIYQFSADKSHFSFVVEEYVPIEEHRQKTERTGHLVVIDIDTGLQVQLAEIKDSVFERAVVDKPRGERFYPYALSPSNEHCIEWDQEHRNLTVTKERTCEVISLIHPRAAVSKLAYASRPGNARFAAVLADNSLCVYTRRRPEYWWGVAWLPEFWLTLLFGVGLVWSVWRDRRSEVKS